MPKHTGMSPRISLAKITNMAIPSSVVRSIKFSLARVFTLMQYYKKNNFYCFCICWSAIFFLFLYTLADVPTAIYDYADQGSEDNILLYKDLYTQEEWPEIGTNLTFPIEIPSNLHYVWCGQKIFRFEDYVGLLSAVRLLRPRKIIFHYHYSPLIDKFWYHTWFQELKQSLPNLVLRYTSATPRCGSREVLEFALSQLAAEGGVYIGERTVLTRIPKEAWSVDFYYKFRTNEMSHDVTQGVIFSSMPFNQDSIPTKLNEIFQYQQYCYTVQEFNSLPNHHEKPSHFVSVQPCLIVTESFYPKDIWNSTTHFAELSRWLYYGKRQRLEVKKGDEKSDLIPLISHMAWVRTNNILKTNEFKFIHYLSVLSALYVAGFKRVYIHGEISPYGQWWDQLKGENVTFIKIENPETIFQQRVRGPSHQSDIIRVVTLLKYGGAYQDRDVIWVNKLPDDLRRYPAVACNDWPKNGEWPEVFNLGVILAKPNADWLKHFLKTFTYYRDDKWAFNAIQMPYKAYEQHPDSLYVDRHLQVICFKGICHPAWHSDYIRDIDDYHPVINYDWREARAFHFTVPKPPDTLKSLEGIKNGIGMFAEMGRMILEKSGRGDMLK